MRPPIAVLALLCALIAASPANGANFVVTTDEDLTSGACLNPSPNSKCPIRVAFHAANFTPEADTIDLQGRTIVLTQKLAGGNTLYTQGDLEYEGDGPLTIKSGTIAGGPGFNDRIIDQLQGDLTLVDVTVTGGSADASTNGGANGGGIYVAGGTLTLDESLVTGNTAGADGGGIHLAGGLQIAGSRISANSAAGGGGGIYQVQGSFDLTGSEVTGNSAAGGAGGGIASLGTHGARKIAGSTVSGNQALSGGGIAHTKGLTVESSLISANAAAQKGGGIESASALWLDDVRITGNSAATGGGLALAGPYTQGRHIHRSTFDGNSARVGGGGLSNESNLFVTESTFSGNEATGGEGASGRGGGIDSLAGSLELTGVTLAGNRAQIGPELAVSAPTMANRTLVAGDCGFLTGGGLTAQGSVETGFSCGFDGPGNKRGATVRLGGLTTHFTPVRPLLGQSDAIDAGGSFACEVDPVDQLGSPRSPGECDAGAFEALKTDHEVTLELPANAQAGAAITGRVSIRNLGPAADSGVAARLFLPPGVELAGGPCSPGSSTTCAIGDLPAGETRSVDVTLRAAGAGAYPVGAGLYSDLAELASGNETPVRTVEVLPRSADSEPPRLELSVARRLSRRGLARSRRLTVRIGASESCRASLVVKAGKKTVARAKPGTLGAQRVKHTVRFSKRAAKRLRRASGLALTLTCIDGAGNRGTAKRKAKLRR